MNVLYKSLNGRSPFGLIDLLIVLCLRRFNVLVISQRFLDTLPVLLVDLFCYQPVSRNDDPATVSAKEGSHYYHLYKVFDMTRPGIEPATF